MAGLLARWRAVVRGILGEPSPPGSPSDTILGGPRVTGRPPSGNGASSFHLWWRMPDSDPLREVSAVFECVEPPAVERRYFWALQASFSDGVRRRGAGHFGLQWAPDHPDHGAVNWGGYRAQDLGGGELEGTDSPLPSSRTGPNTRNYPWVPLRRYRFSIFPAPGEPGVWRGEITDIVTGEATVVRDLMGGGDRLEALIVWTECFADCDHPSATVRWSDLQAMTGAGEVVRPTEVRVTFQAHDRGGCANTNVVVDPTGLSQTTNPRRRVQHGAVIPL